MTANIATDDLVREQAARWAMRLHEDDVDAAERDSFERWLLADERHAREFRAHATIVALTGELPTAAQARLGAFAAADPDAPAIARRRVWVAGLAAFALIAVVAGGWIVTRANGFGAPSYVTKTGENRAVTFEDGSVAYLNTRTKLQWLGDTQDRKVRLLEGEALFDVVHDPARPFRILLDNSEIQVLGTRFDVYRKKSGDVVVTVLEGAVRVQDVGQDGDRPSWQRELHANQRIVYRSIGLTRDVHRTAAVNAIKWRDGVFEIENETLPNVLDELSRYTDRHISISDPRLAQLHLVGALNVRDVRAALARIQKLAPVSVTEHGEDFTLNYQLKPGDTPLSPANR